MNKYIGAYWAVDDATCETHTYPVIVEADNWHDAGLKLSSFCFLNFPESEGYYLHGYQFDLEENVEVI